MKEEYGRRKKTGKRGSNEQTKEGNYCFVYHAGCQLPFGIYRLIQWDIEIRQKEEEAKVREAQEAKEADEEAYKQAKEYMRDYRIELQEQMQAAGIDDIKVGYEKHEHSAWNYEFEGQEAGYQYFYYELKYYSESIDTLFEACAETGEYDSFVELMQKEYKAKEHRPQVSGFHKIHIGDRNYGVRVEDKEDEGELTIYRDIHLYYTLEQEEDGVDLYENTDLVYSTRPGSRYRRKRSRMPAAVAAQSTMVEVVLAEAAMDLSIDLPAEAVPGHSAALTVVPIPGKRQILMMYMTTTIPMILQKSGQRTLETEIMMTDMKMPMTTGKMNMMISFDPDRAAHQCGAFL